MFATSNDMTTFGDYHHAMNQFAHDYRYWKPMKVEEEFAIERFLRLLRKHKLFLRIFHFISKSRQNLAYVVVEANKSL